MQYKSIYTSGITGFIGTNFLPTLLDSYDQVINFTRRDTIEVFTKDSQAEQRISQDFLNQNPSNEFFNLATLHIPNPSSISGMQDLIEANIFFPIRILENLQKFENLKIINALSYTQLLDLPNQNIYSLTKEIFKKFASICVPTNIVNLYLFDTFGTGDTRNKVIDIFIKNILSGSPITIPSNEVNINLSHNSAVSYSLLKAISLESGDYCIKSPNTISLENLADLIMDITDRKVKIVKGNPAVDPLQLIQLFPKNIYQTSAESNFKKQLESRVQEIIQNGP